MMLTGLIEVPNRVAVLSSRGKTEKELQYYVQIIRNWLQKQPHLPEMKERKIEIFIMSCKFRLEKVKKVIDTYYTIRNFVPELFIYADPLDPEVEFCLKTSWFLPLPKTLPDYSRVYVIKQTDDHKKDGDPWISMFVIITIKELMLTGDFCDSQHLVCDLQGCEFSTRMTPSFMKKIMIITRDAYSVRTNSVHFINTQPSFDILFGILKSLCSQKMSERMHIHKDLQTLHNHIPKSVLPKDYGGNEIPLKIMHENWMQKVNANRDFLIHEMKLRSNESKRIRGTNADIFGSIHGTFKQLEID